MKEPREMCVYCAKWHPVKDMYKIKGTLERNWYCARCVPIVESNIRESPWIKK